jgi:hypothetical protein
MDYYCMVVLVSFVVQPNVMGSLFVVRVFFFEICKMSCTELYLLPRPPGGS